MADAVAPTLAEQIEAIAIAIEDGQLENQEKVLAHMDLMTSDLDELESTVANLGQELEEHLQLRERVLTQCKILRICIEELSGHITGEEYQLTLDEILDHAYAAESELFRTQDRTEIALHEIEREELSVAVETQPATEDEEETPESEH